MTANAGARRRSGTERTRTRARDASAPRVRVRMYRHGLGDCFLITFFRGTAPVHALIDCGTLGSRGPVRLDDVAADIAATTSGHISLLVATHEHSDHLSGFRSQRGAFDDIDVDHVWVAWTEDAADPVASELQKHAGDLQQAVSLAALATGGPPAAGDSAWPGTDHGEALRSLLAFSGEPLAVSGEPLAAGKLATTVNEAMAYVLGRGRGRPGGLEFLQPGMRLQPEWLPGVRVYVLGPPRNPKMLKILGRHGDQEVYELSPASVEACAATSRFLASGESMRAYSAAASPGERNLQEAALPFDSRYRVAPDDDRVGAVLARYADPSAAWRRIDTDWAAGASDLALQLDTFTNNTSLVLAFELEEDGRVLLFPGDAQVGNWLSWHEAPARWADASNRGGPTETAAKDLLARTAFYKVGHHGSHNATITDLGLELMTSFDLVAFVPVDHDVALAQRPYPWQMPASRLYKRLLERTRGRTLCSDLGWPEANARPESVSADEWNGARSEARIEVSQTAVDYFL